MNLVQVNSHFLAIFWLHIKTWFEHVFSHNSALQYEISVEQLVLAELDSVLKVEKLMSLKASLMFQHFCAVRPSCHCQWAKATGPADSRAWHCQGTAEDGQRGALLKNPEIPFPGLLITFDNVLQEEQHGGPHGGAGGGRAERLAEELDDMERRVEQVENEDQPTLEKHTQDTPSNFAFNGH